MYTQDQPPLSPQNQDRPSPAAQDRPQMQGQGPGFYGGQAQASMERNVLTALRIMSWVALGLGLLAAMTICGIGAAEMGDWNKITGPGGSGSLGTYMFIKSMAFSAVIGVVSVVLWAVCMALGTLLENSMRTRGRM
jgi:hypothetical protein